MNNEVIYTLDANLKKLAFKEIFIVLIRPFLPFEIIFSAFLIFLLVVGIFFDALAFFYAISAAAGVMFFGFFIIKEAIVLKVGLNTSFDDVNDNGLIECELKKENDTFIKTHLLSQKESVFLKSDIRKIYKTKNFIMLKLIYKLTVVFPNNDEILVLLKNN